MGSELKVMKGFKFDFELGSSLFIEIPGYKNRIQCKIVGCERSKFLLIKTPNLRSSSMYFEKNHRILEGVVQLKVRYIHDGEVFGFEAVTMGFTLRPFRTTFISYPMEVERINLRVKKRISCLLPAQLSVKEMKLKGIISDISSRGARFVTTEITLGDDFGVSKGDEIDFSCYLIGIEEKTVMAGVIKSIALDKSGLSLGIAFTEVEEGLEEKIERYIENVNKYFPHSVG